MNNGKRFTQKQGRIEYNGYMFHTSYTQRNLVKANLYTFLKAVNGKTTIAEILDLFHTLTGKEIDDMIFDYDCATKGSPHFFSEFVR